MDPDRYTKLKNIIMNGFCDEAECELCREIQLIDEIERFRKLFQEREVKNEKRKN